MESLHETVINANCIVCGQSDQLTVVESRFKGQILRCLRCRHEFLNPQPSDESLTEIYSKEYFHTWGINDHEGNVRRLKKKTFGLRFDLLKTKLKNGAPVLDCGCATGYLLEVAQERGYVPFGVDLSAFAASESIRKFGTDHIFCGQLENANFPANPSRKFAAITMMDYIEHVRDPRNILNLASTMLNDGGLLVISTPKLDSRSHLLMKKKWSHYKEEHLFYFSFNAMKKLLEDTGYTEVVEFPAWKYLSFDYIRGHFESYPHPMFTPLIRFAWKIMPAKLSSMPMKFMLGDLVVVARKK